MQGMRGEGGGWREEEGGEGECKQWRRGRWMEGGSGGGECKPGKEREVDGGGRKRGRESRGTETSMQHFRMCHKSHEMCVCPGVEFL